MRVLRTLVHFGWALWRTLRDPEINTLLLLTGVLLAAGTLFYHRVENLSWLDALYFCVISLTTVGYGDFHPQTALGKIFTMIYLIVGLGVLAGFIGVVASHVLENDLRRNLVERRDPSESK